MNCKLCGFPITGNIPSHMFFADCMDAHIRHYQALKTVNMQLLALLKEALAGCSQTAYRDWAKRAETVVKEIEGE